MVVRFGSHLGSKFNRSLVAMYQLSPFEVGQIKAHMHHGCNAEAIRHLVTKADGKSLWTHQAISDTMRRIEDDRKWRGERTVGSGRKRKTRESDDKIVAREVFKRRGSTKVTVAYLKKKFPRLRDLNDQTVANRLYEAGLAWLRRRRKMLVPTKYLEDRVNFGEFVKSRQERTLRKWCFSDGTTYFLDRTEEENESTRRIALGSHVWRMADRSDSLYRDCIGPSGYSKAQGKPVKIWGVLADAQLHVRILPEGENMNKWWYSWIIEHDFPRWVGSCTQVIQDYEKCLRSAEALNAFRKIGVSVLKEYPKCSQDLNPIEGAWKLVRDRLFATLPTELESRDEFLPRLRNAIAWVNTNNKEELSYLSYNMKERAEALLAATPKGSRTRF